VVLPYVNGTKVRFGIPHGERQMYFDRGKKPYLFNGQSITDGCVVFLVEGETDTMRLWQALAAADREVEGGLAVVGLPGANTLQDPHLAAWYAESLSRASKVFVILDNDSDYMVQAQVDAAWKSLRAALPKKAKRVRLPLDVKDVCEFFSRYDLETFDQVIRNVSVPGRSRWSPLDFAAPPPPVRWLVDRQVCRGDVHLLLGEPNLGKSWLTMDLCLAVLQGRPWLGHEVTEPGRVLYVDEENPPDLIFDRLFRLGLRPEDIPRLRYLNNQGILLDRNPDDLLEEALDFQPHLIVLDSLTRFHTGEEDKAGSMSALYNTALKPLARETEAALMLIHHAGKTESNSSYRRSRGSGEIIAMPDAGFDARQAGLNTMTIAMFKSRRRKAGDVMTVAITDTPEGGVKLIGGASLEPPF
jgi:hypothetical protein